MSIYTLLIKELASLSQQTSNSLWLADENMPREAVAALREVTPLTFVTNRFDLYQQATPLLTKDTHRLHFNDFELETLAPDSVTTVVLRITKERPLCHWLLTQSARILQPGGHLILAGKKDEGIKSYADKCLGQLGFSGKLKKNGSDYLARLRLEHNPAAELDHKSYRQLRPIGDAFGYNLLSKPGLYGWQKIDEGSALLAQTFTDYYHDRQFETALDLGCGYGYLSLALAAAGIKEITATDNNAAALQACETNLQTTTAKTQVFPGDCADSCQQKVELVLCNPPFHQGFAVASELTEKFVRAAARLLLPQGVALFVVNAFIPLEKAAQLHFSDIALLQNNRKFKVLALRHREGTST